MRAVRLMQQLRHSPACVPCPMAPERLAPACRLFPFVGRGAASAVETFESSQTQLLELKAKFGDMGLVSHKKVGVGDLYKIFRVASSPEDYKSGLHAMNLFYNFGVKLRHRELATRLLATAMACGCHDEGVELVKLGGTWLEHPPDSALVYALMGHFLDAGQPLVVREIAKAVREDWRMKVEPPLYVLAIEAMLQLEGDVSRRLAEAAALRDDARLVGMRLPAPTHVRLVNECLIAFEADETDGAALEFLGSALRAADGLALDGHLHGGANAAVCCSMAWLFWRVGRLPDEQRAALLEGGHRSGGAMDFLEGKWASCFQAAINNFGCHWGFSACLPRGFFQVLETADCPDAARLVALSRARFGRFYPTGEEPQK
mmetsp:Transcript_118276/g.334265  ORF Transcript_118276/g.334265 Transcript_118276/m.334265 type:complete len:374 (+) Transcript_118276:43-1164(+)